MTSCVPAFIPPTLALVGMFACGSNLVSVLRQQKQVGRGIIHGQDGSLGHFPPHQFLIVGWMSLKKIVDLSGQRQGHHPTRLALEF